MKIMTDKYITNQEESTVSTIWKEYQNGKNYQQMIGLTEKIPLWVDVFEGRHWTPKTENTKDLPRPVFNATEMIIENKIGNILGTKVKLNYVADDDNQAAQKFTKFAEYQLKEMEHEEADRIACLDGLVKGTWIWHYYWDKNVIGKKGKVEGGLRVTCIDPLNIVFANPKERNVQKQAWIIIPSRENLAHVKRLCDKKAKKELIVPDDLETEYQDDYELQDKKKVTVLTKYFKINGEVYFQQATKGTILKEPIPLNPNENYNLILNKIKKERKKEIIDIDGNDLEEIIADGFLSSTQDITREDENDTVSEDYYKASLYPIVVGTFKLKNGSIYGRSEVENLVEVQKAINSLPAFAILNAQLYASPKWVVKRGALAGQQITNKFGEVLTDHSPAGTRGIDIVNPQPFTAGALALAPQLMDMLRTVSNSSEVITGDMIGKDLSGAAIAQLQAQSQKPIVQQQEAFWRAKEQSGKILEMYYKLFYEEKEFKVELTKEEKNIYQQMYPNATIPNYKTEIFNGNDYIDKDFTITIEAGAGTKYSEIQSINMLSQLLQQKLIDLKSYIKFMPQTAMPFKQGLMEHILEEEQSELQQLRQLVQQQGTEMQQMSKYTQQQEKAIRELTAGLDKANSTVGALQKEYSQKINQANQHLAKNSNNGE